MENNTEIEQDLIKLKNLEVRNILLALTVKGQNVKTFLMAIKSLQFSNNSEIQINKDGIKYVTEESKYFQGLVYFSRHFFHRWYYRATENVLNFGLDLTAFCEFCNALIDNNLTSLKVIYYGDIRPMAFIFTQIDDSVPTKSEYPNEITTEYIIRGKNSINPINYITSGTHKCEFIMTAQNFLCIIQELDRSTEELQLSITSTKVTFNSIGMIQCNTQIFSQSDHNIFKYFKHNEDVSYRYNFAFFKRITKSLSISTKVAILVQENGHLNIQLIGKHAISDDESILFFEFNIEANVEDGDELSLIN